MQVASLIWGILAVVGMLVGFMPLLGALNWFNIPFAAAGAILSAVALGRKQVEPKAMSIAGLACCLVAMVFGTIRLVVGLGIL